MIVQCKCDCGMEFEEFDSRGRKREYVNGHQCRGKKHSDKTKQLMSKNNARISGEDHYLYGKHLPDATKQKMSKIRKGKQSGENNPMFGKHHSPKTKQLMSEVHIGIQSGENNPMFGRHHSPETKQKMSEDRCGENHPNWNGGSSRLPYCPIWTPWFKEEIKDRDNHQCQNPVCNKELTKNNPLSVHHIDYDKKNCSANNLITLCNSCNSKANFNRDYWKELYSNIINKEAN